MGALQEIKDLALVLGIDMQNCLAVNKRTSLGGSTSINMTIKSEPENNIQVESKNFTNNHPTNRACSFKLKSTAPQVITSITDENPVIIESDDEADESDSSCATDTEFNPPCDDCGKVFMSTKYLNIHILKVHGLTKNPPSSKDTTKPFEDPVIELNKVPTKEDAEEIKYENKENEYFLSSSSMKTSKKGRKGKLLFCRS